MKSVDELIKLADLLKGLTVLGCQPTSPAALAGVRYGDILLSVNGAPTPDWTSFVRARKESSTHLDLVLFRDGVEHAITVNLSAKQPQPDPVKLLSDLIEQRVLPPDSGDKGDEGNKGSKGNKGNKGSGDPAPS